MVVMVETIGVQAESKEVKGANNDFSSHHSLFEKPPPNTAAPNQAVGVSHSTGIAAGGPLGLGSSWLHPTLSQAIFTGLSV
jgi:hypothetical protein